MSASSSSETPVDTGATGVAGRPPSTAYTWRAMVTSSSVGITRTVTDPRWPSPSQIAARTSGEFAPMPPEKTIVSRPPNAAAIAPIPLRTA